MGWPRRVPPNFFGISFGLTGYAILMALVLVLITGFIPIIGVGTIRLAVRGEPLPAPSAQPALLGSTWSQR